MIELLLELPSIIKEEGEDYFFQLTRTHDHVRCAYLGYDGDFILLVENIITNEDLKEYVEWVKRKYQNDDCEN